MINNSKIGSKLNLLKRLTSKNGNLSGTKAAFIAVSDMSALLHESTDWRQTA